LDRIDGRDISDDPFDVAVPKKRRPVVPLQRSKGHGNKLELFR
jgi:hypothetical protein